MEQKFYGVAGRKQNAVYSVCSLEPSVYFPAGKERPYDLFTLLLPEMWLTKVYFHSAESAGEASAWRGLCDMQISCDSEFLLCRRSLRLTE